jgi:hypothetical protein
MAPQPYVDERKVEYWTSRALDSFFENEGFQVRTFPLTAVTERMVPADFVFFDKQTKKLFGLQYKVLYRNGKDRWNLDEIQHTQLREFDWIYYGLSDLTLTAQENNALHYLRIVSADFDYEARLTRGDFQRRGARFLRWAGFFEGMRACKYGLKITSPAALQRALWPHEDSIAREITQIINDAFLVDFENRRVAKFSSR